MKMSRLTKKQIKQIIDRTPAELKGTCPGSSYIREVFGTYTPAEANWSYVAGWTEDGILGVIRYGKVM